MQISVNGETKTLDRETSLADLLVQFALTPQRVAVELNQRLVRRAEYAETTLHEGDRVEIVTLVGGG